MSPPLLRYPFSTRSSAHLRTCLRPRLPPPDACCVPYEAGLEPLSSEYCGCSCSHSLLVLLAYSFYGHHHVHGTQRSPFLVCKRSPRVPLDPHVFYAALASKHQTSRILACDQKSRIPVRCHTLADEPALHDLLSTAESAYFVTRSRPAIRLRSR